MQIGTATVRDALSSGSDWARDWLSSAAFPLWFDKGADHAEGGWFDKLDRHAEPVDAPKRLRVQARQTFVFAEAGRLDWDGPWSEAVAHGLDFMLARFKRPDGLFRAAVTRDGSPLVETPDLYDQGFALFALAAGYAALGRPAALLDEARALLRTLQLQLGRADRGFEEARPRTLPLRSNPHMHLLEALLAWVEVDGGETFVEEANTIVDLCCERLIDPATGAIGEYYDSEWWFDPDRGHLREPGHQFEWAFLLHRAGPVLGRDCREQWQRLYRFGTRHGIHEGLAVFSLAADGAPVDRSARLWAQTERLRTMLILASHLSPDEGARAFEGAADALAALHRFLDVPTRGLWLDRLDAHGMPLDEPTPASSLYHIVTGLGTLIDVMQPESSGPATGGRA